MHVCNSLKNKVLEILITLIKLYFILFNLFFLSINTSF